MQKIAIIGAGPTAVYTAKYLISKEEPVSLTIFESQAKAGRGTPYHQDWNELEMLANIASIEIPPVTETFVDWLHPRSDEELARMGVVRDQIGERNFLPRIALGKYFEAQLQKLQALATKNGHEMTAKTSHHVMDTEVTADGIKLTVRSSPGKIRDYLFDYVVMATGHAWPKEPEVRPGYFLSPWPSSALQTVPDCHVGIRGTSLSAIDAMVALSVARGTFQRDEHNVLHYYPEPGSEAFRLTMVSRKGLLPEADFYHPIPYEPLSICTKTAVDALIASAPREQLLDQVFALFKTQLAHSDPDYAKQLNLKNLTLEEFSQEYFREREEHAPFVWAARNLSEAKTNQEQGHTVPWRYAILRMHETIARAVPHLLADDHERFSRSFKHVFVDDYATVPHESIERLLAMREAGKLNIIKLGEEYALDTEVPEGGATLTVAGKTIHFPAFIEATGQRPLSLHEFPFPSLWRQGLLKKATTPYFPSAPLGQRKQVAVGGIALDKHFHPFAEIKCTRLYCLSLPFMLGQFPFVQGITSSHDMGKKVAEDIVRQLREEPAFA